MDLLKQLAYGRDYAASQLGLNAGLPFQGAFRLSGGTTSVEEMIASTQCGLFVTRFVDVKVWDYQSTLRRGKTRNALWLIEHGTITKPVRNFQFTDAIVSVLNCVEQLGIPQRVFCPGRLIVVPPLKIQNFNFSSLIDAI